jgi:DNA-binding CsgD family transcriptional regulator/tetratricopeptide (TPR) repeat protein
VETLLEREEELAQLDDLVAEARDRRGSVALVVGEAGIGKSSLVDRWISGLDDAAVHVGWCDDLLSGRALGPLRDIARSARGPLAAAVASGDVGHVLDAVLGLLDDPLRPTVLVLEDLHWADEATLDVVRYVGRRLASLPGVLVVTYREEEIDPRHPLQGVLAALAAVPRSRIAPRPLSREAVASLATARGLDPESVSDTTGGNPFLVSQTLDAPPGTVPRTVVESVLVRMDALSADTRRATEWLSVVPGRVRPGLVEALTGGDPRVLAPAERRGVLAPSPGGGVRFRHELTRVAVLESMTSVERGVAHRLVLDHLLDERPPDHSRILHHAVGAADDAVVVEHGVLAGDEAFDAGAYRAAAVAYEEVLRRRSLLAPEDLARLLERAAWTHHNLQRFATAVDRAAEAVEERRRLGDPDGLARALATLSRARYVHTDSTGALEAAEEAVAVAATGEDLEVAAEAGVARLSAWSLLDRADLAAAAAPDLIAATRTAGRTDLESLALNYGAVARILHEGAVDEPVTMLRDAVTLARSHGHLEPAARAYINIVGAMLLWRRHDEALHWLDEGLDFTADHDLTYFRFTMLAHRGVRLVDVGRWAEAEADFRAMLESTDDPGVLENTAVRGMARVAVRRGDEDAEDLLARAQSAADRSTASQYLGPVAALRAEQGFLTGAPERALAAAQDALALEGAGAWAHGEALAWCHRAGAPLPSGWEHLQVHDEWGHVLAGRWEEAAAMAEADGRVYDRAVALLDSGETDTMLEALAVLDGLGAAPAARIARDRLRTAGVRSVPRGPNRSTRADPAGLTSRQLEVLELIGEGLTNSAIAERLVLSTRTVDHHVSAVLTKLGVTSRHEAPAAHAALLAGDEQG